MSKNLSLLFSLAFLGLLTSCEDVSSNRRQGQNRNPEVERPEVGSEGSENLRSHIHRERGSAILSYAEEIQKVLGGDLPEIYRIIPSMEKDDEGSSKNVLTVNSLGRPTVNCGRGDGFAGIDARISDCFQKNESKALWEGLRYGASGESTWKLVARDGADKEIWLDLRTGMVWSFILTNADGKKLFNWCKASGNDENETPTATTDCNELAAGESLCAGEEIEEVGSQVKWRLPTRNDYLQADINGMRFVLNQVDDRGLWTGTIRSLSEGRSEAWVYSSKEGTLSGGALSSERYVRCIGAPVR